jgi:hypothetical protein
MPETPAPNLRRERSGFEAVSPADVLRRDDLSRDEKIRLLRQWEQDQREEMVAEEENMVASKPVTFTLDTVLEELGVEGSSRPAPTKHG